MAACWPGHALYLAGLELEAGQRPPFAVLLRLRISVEALEALLIARAELGRFDSTDTAIFDISSNLADRIALAREFLEPHQPMARELIEHAEGLLPYCED